MRFLAPIKRRRWPRAGGTPRSKRCASARSSRAVHLVKITHTTSREAESAVLLSNSPDQNGEIGIIMRAGRYDAANSLDLTVKDKPFVLVPSRLADDGDDFDWALYKVTRPT